MNDNKCLQISVWIKWRKSFLNRERYMCQKATRKLLLQKRARVGPERDNGGGSRKHKPACTPNREPNDRGLAHAGPSAATYWVPNIIPSAGPHNPPPPEARKHTNTTQLTLAVTLLPRSSAGRLSRAASVWGPYFNLCIWRGVAVVLSRSVCGAHVMKAEGS